MLKKIEIVCLMNDRFSVIIKRTKNSTIIVFKEGKKTMSIPIEKFEVIFLVKIWRTIIGFILMWQ